jgi:hypothetical protein
MSIAFQTVVQRACEDACGCGVVSCYNWPLACPTDSTKPWTEGDCSDPRDRFSELTLAAITDTGTTTVNGVALTTWINSLFRLDRYGSLTSSLRYTDTVAVVHNGAAAVDIPISLQLDFDDASTHVATFTCSFGTPGSEEIGKVVFTLAACDHDQIVKTGARPGLALVRASSTSGWGNFSSATAHGLYGASVFDYSSSTFVAGNLRWDDSNNLSGAPSGGTITKLLPDPLTDSADAKLVPDNPVAKFTALTFTNTGQFVKIRYGVDSSHYSELKIETTGDLSCTYSSGDGRCVNSGGTYAIAMTLTGSGGGTDSYATDPTTTENAAALDSTCSGVAATACDDYSSSRTLNVGPICFSHLKREGKAYAIVQNLGGFKTAAGLTFAQFEVDASAGKFFQIVISDGVTLSLASGGASVAGTLNTAGQARWFLHPAGGTPQYMDALLDFSPTRELTGSLVSRASDSTGAITVSSTSLGPDPVTGDRIALRWNDDASAVGARSNVLVTSTGGGGYNISGGYGDPLPDPVLLGYNPYPIDMPSAFVSETLGNIEWKDFDTVWLNGLVARDYLSGNWHVTQDPSHLCNWIESTSVNATSGGAGTLKSRSSTSDGVITKTLGVLPSDGDLLDVAWNDDIIFGSRAGVLAHPISGSDVTISGGTGDDLPPAGYTDALDQGAPMMFKVQGASTLATTISTLATATTSNVVISPSPLLPPSGLDPSCDTSSAHQLFTDTDTVTFEFKLKYTLSGVEYAHGHYVEARAGAAYTPTDMPCNTLFESVFGAELPDSASTTTIDWTYATLKVSEPDDAISDNVALHFHPRCSSCSSRLVDSTDAIPLSTASPADTDGRCNACKDCQFTGILYEELLVTGYATKTYDNGGATHGGVSCDGSGDLGCPHLSSINGTYSAWRNDVVPPAPAPTPRCGDCQRCAWRGPTVTVSDGDSDCAGDGALCLPAGVSVGGGDCILGVPNVSTPGGCDPPPSPSSCSDMIRRAEVYPFCPLFEDSCDSYGAAGSPPDADWSRENEWCESSIYVQFNSWFFAKKWRDVTNPRTGNKFNENDPPPRMSDLDGLEIPLLPPKTLVSPITYKCCGAGASAPSIVKGCAVGGGVDPICPYCWIMTIVPPDHVTLALGRRHVT